MNFMIKAHESQYKSGSLSNNLALDTFKASFKDFEQKLTFSGLVPKSRCWDILPIPQNIENCIYFKMIQ